MNPTFKHQFSVLFRKVTIGILSAICISAGVVIYLSPAKTIVLEAISHESGSSWHAQAPSPGPVMQYFYKYRSDNMSNPKASGAVLYEDAVPLGPAHTLHTPIREDGQGRYSHWDGIFYFSTSDNSSPLTNGKSYTVDIPLEPRVRVYVVGLSAMMFLLGVGCLRFSHYRHVRIIFFNVLVFFTLLLTIFACGEIYFRLNYTIMPLNWPPVFKPQIGYIFSPGKTLYQSNNIDYFQAGTINNLGFLDREYIPQENIKRIAFIGDSFVQASEVEISKKSHVVLENMLNAEQVEGADTKYHSYAFGYSGTGQVNQLPFYDYIAKTTNPDIVILIIVSNDFSNNSALMESLRHGWHPQHQPGMTTLRYKDTFVLKDPDESYIDSYNKYTLDENVSSTPSTLQPMFHAIFANSAFYRYISSIAAIKYPQLTFLKGVPYINNDKKVSDRLATLSSIEDYKEILAFEKKDLSYSDLDYGFNNKILSPMYAEAVASTDFALQQWKTRSIEDGFKIIALLSHSVSQYCQEESLYRDRFIELLNKNNITYADQCDTIKKYNRPPSDAHFKYDGHWNEQGHIWAAETLFPLIDEKEE